MAESPLVADFYGADAFFFAVVVFFFAAVFFFAFGFDFRFALVFLAGASAIQVKASSSLIPSVPRSFGTEALISPLVT